MSKRLSKYLKSDQGTPYTPYTIAYKSRGLRYLDSYKDDDECFSLELFKEKRNEKSNYYL